MKNRQNQLRWILTTAIVVGAVVVVATPRLASGAPSPAAVPPAKKDQAKDQADLRYDQGKAYYRTGSYDLAIQEFLAGYELSPRPGVLFNIARAYEELKNRPKAIEFYQRYVELSANQASAAPVVVEARARLVALERQVKDDDERQRTQAVAEREQQRQRELAAAAVTQVPPVTSPTADLSATAPPAASASLARNLKIASVVAGGVGIALTGASVFFAVRGNKLNDEIRGGITDTWTPELAAKDSDMRSAHKLATICVISGGAAIAGAAILYYFGWRETSRVERGKVTLAPSGLTSLALIGQF